MKGGVVTPLFPDLRTVFLVCCVANLVPSLGLLLVHATNRTHPGFRQWAFASLAAFASMLLLAASPAPGSLVTIILVNVTFFAYPLLLARGFRHFAGVPPQNWIARVVLLLVAALAFIFSRFQPNANLRVFLLSFLLVFLFLDCAQLVRREKHLVHPSVKVGLIAAFGLLVAWNLLRVPLAIGIPAWGVGPVAPAVIQAATMILLTAANIWICFGVMLLNFAHATESVRESEERFRLALHHSPIGMALVGLDGRWLEVNPALCRIVGRSREQMLGERFQSVTHPEDLTTDQELIHRLVTRQVPSYRREKRYVHQDGHTIWVQVDVSIIFNADGSPRHLVSQIVDVSERKRTEQALRESRSRLALALDTARLGHWDFDVASGRFTFDDSFFKLLGTSAEREGGPTMSAEAYASRFIPPEEAAVVADEVRLALATTDPHYTRQLEHHFRRADGSIGVMAVRFAIEKDAAGRTVRTFGLNQDVTDQIQAARQRKALEEQLRHAQKLEALGTLAGGIAHDFNNILTGIMGHLQLAEMDLPDDHTVQANLREAGRAARRARDLVARILTFSRRYPSERTSTPLGPVVREAVELLRASLPATIEIRTSIAEECPPVVCDPSQIHQLVMNLGTNSAHAMRDRTGRLEIELAVVAPDRVLQARHPQVLDRHRVRLTVRDTGAGMSGDVLEHIFEPFFTTKAPGEGTGLGLAMVHGIMEDHEGAIVVDSTVDRGTTVDLYFPTAESARRGEAAPSGGGAAPWREPFGRGRRIMLVDDDDAVLNVGQDILTRCGFIPETFSSPAAALEKFAAAPGECAAVISDLTMPGMTGVELALRLKAIRPGVPFLLASGYLHAEAHAGAQESGVTHFVRKPFDLDELVGRLREALDRGGAA